MGDIKTLVSSIGAEAQYDENAKALLVQKPFLANILVRTIEEFYEMDSRDVEKLIEGDPLVSEVAVEPGLTNQPKKLIDKVGAQQITGMNNESEVRGEGVRTFDVLFYVRIRDGLAKIIVNVEAQKSDPTEYDVEMRGIYYASRLMSSQLDRDFTKSDYNGIQKVYSIWICMNCKENTINRIHLSNEEILGETRWKEQYDALNVVLIRLKKTLDQDKTHELHRFLGALFLPTMTIEEKEEIIEKEFEIPLEGERKELIGTMCNLGEGIKEEALREGEIRGELKGRAFGIIEMGLEMGLSETEILERVEAKLAVTKEQASEYFDMHQKKHVITK